MHDDHPSWMHGCFGTEECAFGNMSACNGVKLSSVMCMVDGVMFCSLRLSGMVWGAPQPHIPHNGTVRAAIWADTPTTFGHDILSSELNAFT